MTTRIGLDRAGTFAQSAATGEKFYFAFPAPKSLTRAEPAERSSEGALRSSEAKGPLEPYYAARAAARASRPSILAPSTQELDDAWQDLPVEERWTVLRTRLAAQGQSSKAVFS
jgi:hypothetical protein